MGDSWPADIPWSLWKYQSLTISDVPQVPMMGVIFAPGFLYAFAFGCMFVAFFSWQRFRRPTEDVKSSSEALRDFKPTDLGGRDALLRAYFIYAGSMLILYVSLTFFGKLIFQATQMIPIAGISVDVAELKFDSPQWPLTLAFAFAGLADLLPPVRLAEGWLRNRAYRAAGIPVRLEQTTRSLIATLEDRWKRHDKATGKKAENKSAGALTRSLNRYSESWKKQIETNVRAKRLLEKRVSRYEELIALLAEIELLVVWAKTARGSWPGAEVSFRVREVEAKFVEAADTLLNAFQRRLRESVTPDSTTPEVSIERFDDFLSQMTKDARTIRFELVSFLAIFLERDPDVPDLAKTSNLNEPRAIDALADLLHDTDRPDSAGTGPEAGLLVLLIPVFILFAASAWQGVQELVGQYVETTNLKGVLLTALLETLKIAALTWLPLLAAFSLRQYLWDTKDWAGPRRRRAHRSSSRLSQMIACLGLALAASLLGLTGVALLRAFSIAPNANYFNALLFDGASPFILYYPSLAVILIPLVPLCLLAADARAEGNSALGYAVISAGAVLLVSIAHGRFWDPTWPDACFQISTFATADCSRRSDTLSRLILTVLVFLSTWVLGGPGPSCLRGRSHAQMAGWMLCIVSVGLFVLASPVLAEEKTTIRVGFRDDVEPFSYRVPGEDNRSRHIGYLADLCYGIFEDSKYQIEEQSVTAANRFKLVNGTAVDNIGPIDVLCDAVTMRFTKASRSANGDDDGERGKDSIYSPIVFASGVSYLDRSSREPTTQSGDVTIGYVPGTTAADVALKSCQVDLFKALAPTQRNAIFERCRFLDLAVAAKRKIEALQKSESSMVNADPTSLCDSECKVRRFATAHAMREALKEAQDLVNIHVQPEQGGVKPPPLPSQTMAQALLHTVQGFCRQNNEQTGDCVAALDSRALGAVKAALIDPACPPLNKPVKGSWREYHFCPMETYDKLIKWFCAGDTSSRRIYMGDRELILGKLESWNAKSTPCVAEQPSGAEYLTYEPYALLINRSKPDLVQFVQRRVYEIFSHRATATALFTSYFPKRTMSPALAYLFLLNATDPEEGYLMPDTSESPPTTQLTVPPQVLNEVPTSVQPAR